MRQTKRDELVRKALEVFYRNGFHATGMDMLVKETGVSKTSMYKHFRTKEDLIVAALSLRDENFRAWFSRRIGELADTPRGQMMAIFDVLEEWFGMPEFCGCMFIKASAEFQDKTHPVHIQSAEHKRILSNQFCDLAKQAGARNPQTLACHLFLLTEGAIVAAAMGYCDAPARYAKSAAIGMIEQAISTAA